jgi:hypothetical protein
MAHDETTVRKVLDRARSAGSADAVQEAFKTIIANTRRYKERGARCRAHPGGPMCYR